jgi:hypothetical protein
VYRTCAANDIEGEVWLIDAAHNEKFVKFM